MSGEHTHSLLSGSGLSDTEKGEADLQQPKMCRGSQGLKDSPTHGSDPNKSSNDEEIIPSYESMYESLRGPYVTELRIGSTDYLNNLDDLKPVTKLEDEQNWPGWKFSFFNYLRALPSIYEEIFSGHAQPPMRPTYWSTTRESIQKAVVEEKLWFAEVSGESDKLSATTVTDEELKDKQKELHLENNRRRKLYEENKSKWATALTRARSMLDSCIGSVPKTLIYKMNDPRESYLALEGLFGKMPPTSLALRLKKWTELRYKGNNAAQHVRRFRKAKLEWEECTQKVDPEFEMSLFLTSIMSNPRCVPFLQGFVFSDMNTLYRRSIDL
ncbi:unnamed protein product [Penicillium bialowiezense]